MTEREQLVWVCILVAALMVVCSLGGCARPAPTKRERARVIALPYVPAVASVHAVVGVHGSPAAPTYGVVFACQHGLTALSGADAWHERLWKSLREDEWVDVEYREVRDARGKVVRLETTSVEPALDSRGNCAWHPLIKKPEGKDCEDCYTDVDKLEISL